MSPIQDKCIDARQLERLLHDQLDDSEETDVLRHMDACPKCQEAIESLTADRDLWDELPTRLANFAQSRPGLDETSDHDRQAHDGGVVELIEYLGPTDHPDMLGRIGTYEICGVVGRGSTGIVLKSFEVSLNRYVAIKVLSPALSGNGAARDRFEREARAIAAVVHEHVVPIIAVDEHQGLPYFVMQYVAGASLQHRIERQGPLDRCEVVRIAMQIASGLAAAHAQGIVHRDIKPANILLEHGMDRVLVSDFGLARVNDSATVTMSGMIAGTPSYMAPEQARGEQVDQRSDLFSLGSVMYAMCTARPPFSSETVYGVIRRICDDVPRPIRESNPEIPEWLERLTGKLLSKDPEHRFRSADQVAAILSRELAHMQNPTLVKAPRRSWLRPEEIVTTQPSSGSRNRMIAAIGLSVAAILAITAAGVITNGTANDQAKSDASRSESAAVDAVDGADSRPDPTLLDGHFVPQAGRFAAAPAGGDAGSYANAVAFAEPVENIKIDGDPSDWPDTLPRYPIARAEVGARPRDGNDLDASFRIGYSSEENALYIVVEVSDDSLVIDAEAGQTMWNAQDGCEVYIDKLHRREGSPLAQYTRYGDSLNAFGSNAGVKGVDLIVGDFSASGAENADQLDVGDAPAPSRCYEWRIRLDDGVEPGRSMGFDLAILDKDQDGTFTWLTWGTGTHKLFSPNRCGAVVFVEKETQFGSVTGTIACNGHAGAIRPRVCLRSLDGPERWTLIDSDEAGRYTARLPLGTYAVEAADDADHRFRPVEPVQIAIEADKSVQAETLTVEVRHIPGREVSWGGSGSIHVDGEIVFGNGVESDVRNDSIAVAYPMPAVVIDGDLSDWPDGQDVYAFGPCQCGDDPKSDDDASGRFRVGYNVEQQAIYVAVEVFDDSRVFDGYAASDWTAQDGNEIYLDPEHRKDTSTVEQYSFYGDKLQGRHGNVQVTLGDTPEGRVYEWKIRTGDAVRAGRSLGFDVSLLDKDGDGSFSWLAWGQGTQKAWYPQRCGNLLLVEADERFGTVQGSAHWSDASDGPLPRVCFQSLDSTSFRPRVACDAEGSYSVRLPVGRYLVGAVGLESPGIQVEVEADGEVNVDTLQLTRTHHRDR